ncbi:hypothetical protein KAJ83_14490 [Marivibrio halodurans]|uniref:Uncharacterized protein n=1 Tax=Marivibrio halodurans TaxID=2039722 RepID=A0A8J7V3C6_9PROT|nr:hypothetical protein [Marivibrio halodurans]MBP5858225.1 hypothetical protein [Marivibrio halodurans]
MATRLASPLSRGIFTLIAALFIGGDLFGILSALDWAVLHQFGLGMDALWIGSIAAAIPALIAAFFFGRTVWRVEARGIDYEPSV